MLKKDRLKRKTRIRGKIEGTSSRPRLSVFRSNKALYAQLIDDSKGVTVAHAKGANAEEVGAAIAVAGSQAKIQEVVFDRSGYIYHGRIKALADAARAGGLKF